jgi:hypothetical protein
VNFENPRFVLLCAFAAAFGWVIGSKIAELLYVSFKSFLEGLLIRRRCFVAGATQSQIEDHLGLIGTYGAGQSLFTYPSCHAKCPVCKVLGCGPAIPPFDRPYPFVPPNP